MLKTHRKIKSLSEDIISKIAAGEVINRPSYVLKELIENSIDAGATNIEVHIEEGGKKLIQVIDNGIGIHPEDLVLAVKRYTTSKIEDINDIYNLNSYGFRGEALYSISSVSKFSITSRTKEFDLGKELYIEGGKIISLTDTGSPVGTKIKVKDIFFNLPARRKFLKSSQVEFIHILETFIKYTLIHPDKNFRLIKDNKEYLNLEKSILKERIEDIYPKIRNKLLKINASSDLGNVEGYIALDESYKKTGFLFINSRPIKNRDLVKFIKSIIGEKFFIIFINLPPYFVDFNVHPTKEEVKLKKEKPVFELIKVALTKQENSFTDILNKKIDRKFLLKQEVKGYNSDKVFKILGQVENTFLVVYFDGEIYLIDQHVAHERINFELLRREYLKDGKLKAKELNLHLKINLTDTELEKLKIISNELKNLGFEFSIKDNTIFLKKIPIYISSKNVKNVILDLIHSLDTKLTIEDLIGEIACAKSIKSGEFLENKEAQAILKNWLATDNPNLCPHGRPIYFKISLDYVKKVLGRGYSAL